VVALWFRQWPFRLEWTVDDRQDDKRSGEQWRSDVAQSMRRLNDELSQEKWRNFSGQMQRVGEQLARGLTQEALYQASRALERAEEKRQSKLDREAYRRTSRAARRAAKQEAKRAIRRATTSPVEGYVSLAAAAVLVALVFAMPQLWWMIFIAIMMAGRGARVLSWHRNEKPAQLNATSTATPAGVDTRAARIDEVCNKLLAALKDAPASVRDFLSTPEATVEGLRKSCQELLKREIALRDLARPEEIERLRQERAGLEARIAAESDELVRTRLQGALAALDNQRAQQAEVLKSANRLEAERTRLGYTLDGLYAQVMRVRTAGAEDGEIVQAGLRTSLDQLREEMNALADAVESVNRVPVMEPDSEPTGGGGRTRVRS
jgi:hypothetical protein